MSVQAQKASLASFFKREEEPERARRWRFIAKGTSLAAILAVWGAEFVEGDEQDSVKVPAAGDLELGDVLRHWHQQAAAASVTLADLVSLVQARQAGVDTVGVLTQLAAQMARK